MNRLDFLVVDLPEDVDKLVAFGDFSKANELIDLYMSRSIPQVLKNRLAFEKDRLERLQREYLYSFDEAFSLVAQDIEDFTKEELHSLKDERYADWIFRDGQVFFHQRFLNNLIKVHPTIEKRMGGPKPKDKSAEILETAMDDLVTKGKVKYLIQVKTGVKLKDEFVKEGELIKVHLPIPRKAQQISNIKILSTSHKPKAVASPYHPQRTVYFEETCQRNQEFTVEYSYESTLSYNELSSVDFAEHQPTFYTEEWLPHIRFTPFLKELAREIVGAETNPLIQARRIYDYITKNVQYTFVRQYASITSIAEYGAYNLKGDCGIQALLFITLCRIVGVPARWQSGLVIDPYRIGCHDWAEFYIEPYGWLFADPSFGGDGYRKGNERKWNFYFGNLDPFRMVANSEFNYPLHPAKDFLRDDPCDNQIGEVEYACGPVFKHQYELIQEMIKVEKVDWKVDEEV